MKRMIIFPCSLQLLSNISLILLLFAAFVFMGAGCSKFNIDRQGPPVTVQEIVDMNKKGISPDEIINRIKASGTIYRLKASQYAKLHDQGVSDKVLNFMQEVFLKTLKKNIRLQDWEKWKFYNDYWYGGWPYGWPDEWMPY